MSHIKELLNKSSLFNPLGQDDLQRIEPLFEKREIDPGDILAATGDAAQYFFILNNGTLLLDMDEGKSLVLNTAGDFIGLELLSIKGVYKTTLTVLEKGNVFVISRQDFLDIIQENSVAALTIMASWQKYLDKTAPFVKNIEDLSFF